MSKSPSQLILPALGGTALLLGVAYGIASRDFGGDKIERLNAQLVSSKAKEQVSGAKAAAAEERITELAAKVEAAETQPASDEISASLTAPAPILDAPLKLGRPALAEEVAAWDIDVSPDGSGLPEGRGDAYTGEEIFADKCASCHGDFAEGVDNWPVLAGGFDTLADKDPVKTVGSYWPHLSTVWDYVHRSMPFGDAQSVTDDEVYAIVAYILYSNDLVDEDFELSHENFADFQMHNKSGFIVDDRAETEYPIWRQEPCMTACKTSVEITMHASVLDVTPDEEASEKTPTVEESDNGTAENSDVAEEVEALNAELVAAGEKVFRKCKACHAVGDGAKNKSGPVLNGVFGNPAASVDGFKYSGALKAANSDGLLWNTADLEAFLTKPKAFLSGTKMSFAGLKKETDRQAVIEYLKSFGE